GEMPTGAYRKLSPEEIRKLKTPIPSRDRAVEDATERRPRATATGKRRSAATSGKPGTARKGSSAPRAAAGPRTGGRPIRGRGSDSAQPVQGLPELSGSRTGVVIGADPVVKKD